MDDPIWTVEATMNMLAVIPLSLCIFILLKQYFKRKDRQIFILIIGWASLLLFFATEALSYALRSMELFKIHSIFFFITGFCTVIWIDYISQDKLKPFKLSVFSMFVAINFFLTFQTGYIYSYYYLNGDFSFGLQGANVYSTVATTFYMGSMWVFFTYKIHKNAPRYLKKYSGSLLIGAILFSFIPPILVMSRITTIIPGIDMIPITLGALMTSITLTKKPELSYVLPFKVLKLAVVGSASNKILYIHRWVLPKDFYQNPNQLSQEDYAEDELDETLFSGMLYGVARFVKETIRKGSIQEISTDEATLMLHNHHQFPILFALLTTNITFALRLAFNNFIEKYIKQFSIYQFKVQDPTLIQETELLVSECFPFIPYLDYNSLPKSHNKSIKKEIDVLIEDEPSFCISCHNIKNEYGTWENMETYLKHNLGTKLSWELCPICSQRKYVLIASFFCEMYGPKILIQSPEEIRFMKREEIPSILDMDNHGFFLHTFGELIVANYQFYLPSKKARGKKLFMLLSMIDLDGTINKEFAQVFLSNIVGDILSIVHLDRSFNTKTGKIDKESFEFKSFLKLFSQSCKMIPEKMIEFYITSELLKNRPKLSHIN